MQQCDAEFVNALDTALAKCGDEGYQFSDLPKRQMEIASYMNDALDASWSERRGMVVEVVAIAKVTPDDESRKRIETIDDAIMMGDQRVAAGRLAQAQATAMENAASNEAGAMNGFIGMGFAQQAGGMNASAMFQNLPPHENNPLFQGATTPQQPQGTSSAGWTCSCGAVNSGNFCSNCGKPNPNGPWTCSCGAKNTGNFCSNCGKKRPE